MTGAGARAAVAMLLAVGLMGTPLRAVLEASMTLHMLLQIPLLLVAGLLLGSAIPERWCRRLDPFNPGGATGLIVGATALTVFMIPRALDLAVARPDVAAAKVALLLTGGVLLRLSWGRAGLLGQAFFMGNLAWMGAVVGLLLREAPQRVCTTYLAADQQHAGTGLLLLATAIGLRWFMARLGAPEAPAAPTAPTAATTATALAARTTAHDHGRAWRVRREN
jgi:hypothetical protein